MIPWHSWKTLVCNSEATALIQQQPCMIFHNQITALHHRRCPHPPDMKKEIYGGRSCSLEIQPTVVLLMCAWVKIHYWFIVIVGSGKGKAWSWQQIWRHLKVVFFPLFLLKSSGMNEALAHRLYMDMEWKRSTTDDKPSHNQFGCCDLLLWKKCEDSKQISYIVVNWSDTCGSDFQDFSWHCLLLVQNTNVFHLSAVLSHRKLPS